MGLQFEWQIHTPQAALLGWMQQHWWERGAAIEVIDGPQDVAAWQDYFNGPLDDASSPFEEYALVYATSPGGWTAVVPITMPWDDAVWQQMSWDLQAAILAGEYNSIVEQRHWVWIDNGQLQVEHWHFSDGTGTKWQRDPTYPIKATLSLDDAFAHILERFPADLRLGGCKRVRLEKGVLSTRR